MRRALFLTAFSLVAACGSDTVGNRTAATAQQNAAQRDAALESRIDNPAALACIRENASEEEWAVIETETGDAPAVLQTVLNRDGTVRCFRANNVVIYI
jgi:hypothetical protein